MRVSCSVAATYAAAYGHGRSIRGSLKDRTRVDAGLHEYSRGMAAAGRSQLRTHVRMAFAAVNFTLDRFADVADWRHTIVNQPFLGERQVSLVHETQINTAYLPL